MVKQRKVQTNSFRARSTSGKDYTINEYTTQILQEFLSGPSSWLDGSKQYQVSGGGFANKLNDTTFEIVATGEQVTKV